MYLEQNSNGMHREGQRTSATTIFITLATALLALIASRWKPGVPFDQSFLPLTIGLAILSLAGVALVMKIFERSQVNFTIADAYRQTCDLIISEDVAILTSGRVSDIKYVFGATSHLNHPDRRELYAVSFKGNRKVRIKLSNDEQRDVIAAHNPVDPREIVIPEHNALATWMGVSWVMFDTHKVWASIHIIYFALGVGLSVIAAWEGMS